MFDIIQWQQDVRSAVDPRTLYGFWDQICRYKDKGTVRQQDFEECRDLILPKLQALESLKKSLQA